MATKNEYHLADLTLALLTRQATKRTNQTKNKLITLGFDELNVLQEIDSLYEWLDNNNRKKYRELFEERYFEVYGMKLDGDEVDEWFEVWLAGILEEPNDVTHYTYSTEVLRKRDRAKEAILAVPTKMQKQLEIDKALRIFMQQTRFYTDIVSDEATWHALDDLGIKKVRWNAQDDKRVCSTCDSMDGKIYPINKVPNKPHPLCRCYLLPI